MANYDRLIIPWFRPNHWNIAYIEQKSICYFEPFNRNKKLPDDFEGLMSRLYGPGNYRQEFLSFTEQTNSWHCGYLCLIVIIYSNRI